MAELLAKATRQNALDAAVSKEDREKLLESLRAWGALDAFGCVHAAERADLDQHRRRCREQLRRSKADAPFQGPERRQTALVGGEICNLFQQDERERIANRRLCPTKAAFELSHDLRKRRRHCGSPFAIDEGPH